jgi:hypothetical protein
MNDYEYEVREQRDNLERRCIALEAELKTTGDSLIAERAVKQELLEALDSSRCFKDHTLLESRNCKRCSTRSKYASSRRGDAIEH